MNCPICLAPTIQKTSYSPKNGRTSYQCSINLNDPVYNNHYSCEYINGTLHSEKVCLKPWMLDNFNTINKSRLYKIISKEEMPSGLVFIKELSLIKADVEEKLFQRLNNLIIFL